MAAPKGNQFWKLRRLHSHPEQMKFRTPEDLWDACCRYFEWVEAHPLYETKVFQWKGRIIQEHARKMRAMSIRGLLLFLPLHRSTWEDYKKRPAFDDVVEQAESIIWDWKFTGAAAGLLNPVIIARELATRRPT